MNTLELTIRGSVESLHLEPGDRIIITLDDKITQRHFNEAVEQIREQFRKEFPDHEVIIMSAGLRITRQSGK